MKCIMVMFDSLNRHHLPPYGCDWTHAPNFARLAQRTVTFDKSYVCSMPCMPARRDLHTGRPNFLHRSWGPLEPFDDSMPKMLSNAGVYTHLATDHYHYFEDGGATYHTKYTSWEFFRGQEGDYWKGQVAEPVAPAMLGRSAKDSHVRQDLVNRQFMRNEEDQPQAQTFRAGVEFIRRNHEQDKWFLQIETFDPHEPFFSNRKYKDLYPHEYTGPRFDWPPYSKVSETPEQVAHMRHEYASLLSMCDSKLGDILDLMDELDMWKDTMLIVWTDHGFLLGEHEYWAKVRMPFYEEVSHTPFFVWDPRCGKKNQRRQSLVQPSIDLPLTLLDFFGVEPTPSMLGKSLRDTIADDKPVREAGLFGVFGGQVNVTDGQWVYMRATEDPDAALADYTLMPTRMTRPFSVEELQHIELSEPQAWARNLRMLKITAPNAKADFVKWFTDETHQTQLYDLKSDPHQERPVKNADAEARLSGHLASLMRQCDAPAEQFERLGLPAEG